ncbi:MAG: hypothetical protein M0P52_14535 [Rhodoferax sp.]|jgi:ElaB/YqjD/DUF883 family membrane-anchored ribosome-binding protein|nr:hypothetical protein [Rhodoferax sp.]
MFSNKLTDTSTSLINQTSHAAEQAIQATQHLANNAMESVLDTSHQLRLKARHASESTVSYIKHEPVKSILIAAAAGAALMVLISLLSSSRGRR